MAAANYFDSVQKLYIAFYQRPADSAGLLYWSQRLDAANGSLEGVIDAFASSAEATALYGAINKDTVGSVVDKIYQALFNRAPDEAGKKYYVDGFLAGKFTAGKIALDVLNGASNDDLVAIGNKMAVANNFTRTVDGRALDNPEFGIGSVFAATYAGDTDAQNARELLAGVTSKPETVLSAKQVVEQVQTKIADDGDAVGGKDSTQTFTLTNGTDVASANKFVAGQVYTPGGDDRINSLQDEDVLTGTGTNPTLDATLGNANDNGATIITPKLTGVETVNVAFTGSGGGAVTALDLQDATGVDSVNVTRVSQAINSAEVGNIKQVVSTMSVSNTNANNAGVVELSFANNVLLGDNTGALTVSDVQIGVLNVGQNTSGIGARGVSLRGYENLTLNSTGAANIIGTLNLPMDTGTTGKLTITGDSNLRLGANANIVNNPNGALIEAASIWAAGTGVAQAGGRIATIDASALQGNLEIVLDNILDVGKADTSGVVQNVAVIGGQGNDTFALFDAIQAGDTVNGGQGTDTLVFSNGSSIASNAVSIENADFQLNGVAVVGGVPAAAAAATAVDFDFLADATAETVRNVSNNPLTNVNFPGGSTTFTLYDLNATQAANITVKHSTTGNGQIANTVIEAAVKTNTAADTIGVTIAEGTNVDPRFNFTIDTVVANTGTSTTAAASTFENVTITDADSESNSVELNNFAQHTGTITLGGAGVAGTYLNLDVDTAGADVTTVITGTTIDASQTQQGLYGLDTDGSGVDFAAGNIADVGALATQVRLGAAAITATTASNAIVRVSTNAASVVGAQAITMGAGNDTVIFDNLNDNRAGLTISDTVVGGTGNDTLVIDGNGVNVNLGASEWTNVSGFETIRTVGLGGGFNYTLSLTDALIDANAADGNLINIINDNDASNDVAGGANTASTGAESAVTIDASALSATNSFTYNGEENGGITADRFIFSDANINGKAIIDGGAIDNSAVTNSGPNGDVIDIRNNAVATAGDLANLKNVGTIAFNNTQATAQRLTLQLNDSVVDSMVDSYHTSAASAGRTEVLNVTLLDAAVTEVAGVGIDLDIRGLTGKSAINLTLNATAAGAAVDNLTLSAAGGVVTAAGFETAASLVSAVNDVIVLSKASFTALASAAGGLINAGGALDFVANATGQAALVTDRIIFDNAGAGAGNLWYDVDGSGVGQAVLIATLTGVTDLAAADISIIA